MTAPEDQPIEDATEAPKRRAKEPPWVDDFRGTMGEVALMLGRMDQKIDHLYGRMAEGQKTSWDHEVRLRVAEQSLSSTGGIAALVARLRALEEGYTKLQTRWGTASWVWQAAWPAIAVGLSALAYFTK